MSAARRFLVYPPRWPTPSFSLTVSCKWSMDSRFRALEDAFESGTSGYSARSLAQVMINSEDLLLAASESIPFSWRADSSHGQMASRPRSAASPPRLSLSSSRTVQLLGTTPN